MKEKIKISLLLVFVPTFLVAQKVSLKEAIETTLQRNERIAQYKERVIQKEYQEKSSWGNFLPSIEFKASYTHLNQNMDINLNPIRDAMITLQSGNQAEFMNLSNILSGLGALSPAQKLAVKNQSAALLNTLLPEFKQTFKKQDYLTATFQGVQPLFTGGKLLAAKNYAKAEKEASEIELVKIENEAVSETVANYLRSALLKEVVKVRKEVLTGIQEHKKRAQKLYDEGVIANYHVLRANVALSEAENKLSEDESNYRLSLLALKNSIGTETEIEPADSIKFFPIAVTLEESLASASKNQPILRLLDKKKIGAEQNYNLSISSFLPTVAAFGKFELYPEYLSSLEPRWAVGLQMNLSVFNGFKDHIKVQEAKHLENEVSLLQSDTRKKIELWVSKAYSEIEKNRIKYEKLNSTIELAIENVRQNEKRFETGMGISLEVIDAHLMLEKARLESYLSLFDYYRSAADLMLAVGEPESILKIWNN